jgi:hypothetical protein
MDFKQGNPLHHSLPDSKLFHVRVHVYRIPL